MTTRDLSEPAEESVEDEAFDVPDDQKPKTGRELYEALVANGFIGAWKDRTDIGDTLDFVQRLKDKRRERRQARLWDIPHISKEAFMATRKLTPEETHEKSVDNEEIADEDTWEFPSSSPDKKILTAKAILESGLVGIWKDRTDIGDSVAYARKLRRQANKRNQD